MIVLLVIGIILTLGFIGGIIYNATGFGKRFYHNILKWHKPDSKASLSFDGCSFHSICEHCGKDIMKDSQGNWF